MKEPTIEIQRKCMLSVKVHTVCYNDEARPEPQFDGELLAVLRRNELTWNGNGATFYVARNGLWEVHNG